MKATQKSHFSSFEDLYNEALHRGLIKHLFVGKYQLEKDLNRSEILAYRNGFEEYLKAKKGIKFSDKNLEHQKYLTIPSQGIFNNHKKQELC